MVKATKNTTDAKRLSPTKDTIRELFAKPGNQCYIDGCKQVMVENDG